MPIDEDQLGRALEHERPGPADLESVLENETLASIASRSPLVLDADTRLAEVVRQMQKQDHGCALLVSDGKLVGIFTERDLLAKVAGHGLDFQSEKVGAYMTPDPVTLPADSSVAYALNKMVLEGFRHIPLVDDAGRPAGAVSMRDLMEFLTESFHKDVLNLPPDPRARSHSREGA